MYQLHSCRRDSNLLAIHLEDHCAPALFTVLSCRIRFRDRYWSCLDTWFHFLSRHPNIDEYNRLRVVDPAGTLNSKPPALWDRFGCYLKIGLYAHSSALDATTSNRGLVESPVSISGPNSSACISSSKGQAGTTLRSPPSNWKRCVTFVCFGSTQDIRDRL
jgi:hypothetical protein